MKKLKLQRETVRVLNHMDYGRIHGGAITPGTIRSVACPPIQSVAGCTGGSCVETLTTGTSVILPSGGLPSGG